MARERNSPRFRADAPKAAEMWRDGATYEEIASAFGISTGLVGNWLHRRRQEDPSLPERRPEAWSDDEDARLKAFFADGDSTKQIGASLGRGAWGVERRITELGLRSTYADTWSVDDDQALAAAFLAGDTVARIAESTGRTPAQINTRLEHLRDQGHDLPARKPRWTDEERDRLARRYREGASYKQLAAEFGKAKGTVSRQLRQLRDAGVDLTREEPSDHGYHDGGAG